MCFDFIRSQNSKHILASMIYFDSDMTKSTNTVVYFDWKTVIYIHVCGKCRTQFMLPMEKSVITFTGACANEIIPSINRLFAYKAKEGRHVRIFFINQVKSHELGKDRIVLSSKPSTSPWALHDHERWKAVV